MNCKAGAGGFGSALKFPFQRKDVHCDCLGNNLHFYLVSCI